MAAVYAALASTSNILNQLTIQNHPILQAFPQQVESIVKNVQFLLGVLEGQNLEFQESINSMKANIIKAAHGVQDIIESHKLSVTKQASPSSSELEKVVEEFDQAVKEVEMKKPITYGSTIPFLCLIGLPIGMHKRAQELHRNPFSARRSSWMSKTGGSRLSTGRQMSDKQILDFLYKQYRARFPPSDYGHPLPSIPDRIRDTVGLDEDMVNMKELLSGGSSDLQVISVVGMGGLGKTTLANNIFYDPLIEQQFHCRSWVTITPSYSSERIVQALLHSMIGIPEDPCNKTEDQLRKCLRKRKYLIVLDDVWHKEAWDRVRKLFPNDKNGSRIILTTRDEDLAVHAGPRNMYQKKFLNEDQSWELLKQNVFAEDCCNVEIEEIGKGIARNCGGLALSILVIAGLLSKSKEDKNHWEKLSRDVSSAVAENDESKSSTNILLLSYNNLPHHLKPCFLYFGLFHEDYQIPVFKIISMWVAEGFVKSDACKSLEQVAEEYFQELVKRNLVLITKRSYSGKLKLCGLHDLLKNLCMKKADEEDFIHLIQKTEDTMKNKFRIQIADSSVIDHIRNANADAISAIRSVFCPAFNGELVGFKNLRVLDVLHVSFESFPLNLLQLVHLRYLCFSSSFIGNFKLPDSLSQLQNLETLIIRLADSGDVVAASSPPIWKMPKLRHLIVPELQLLPFPLETNQEFHALESLQTLSLVHNFKFTNEAISMISNLRKLKTVYRCESLVQISEFQLDNLSRLTQLNTLNLNFHPSPDWWGKSRPIPFKLPCSLKKLVLSHCGISWSDMSIIGSLPNLEILKLRTRSVIGDQWETLKGKFNQLKVLLMERLELKEWLAESSHFPNLQHLIIRYCSELECIPSEVGEISSLQLIELHNSERVIVSAKLILEEQRGNGNEDLQVRIDGHLIYIEVSEPEDGNISDSLKSESEKDEPEVLEALHTDD